MKKLLLLVDDEHGFRRVFRSLLMVYSQESGTETYDLREAASIEEAVQVFERQPRAWDAIIVDFLMGQGRGDDLIRRIRHTNPRVGIVVITGDPEGAEHACTGLGVWSIVPKPIMSLADFGSLMTKVDAAAQLTRMPDQTLKDVGTTLKIETQNLVSRAKRRLAIEGGATPAWS